MSDDNFQADERSTAELNLESLNRKIWLVKVPKFLASRWRESDGEDGRELGRVKITIPAKSKSTTAGAPEVTLHLSNDEVNAGVPKSYTLNFAKHEVKNMFVFTDNKDGTAHSIEGTIHHECSITPIINDEYRRIMRARHEEAARPKRTIQVLDDSDRPVRSVGMMEGFSLASKRVKRSTDDRKERLPRNDLVELLFRAFSLHEYWSFKGLVEYTKQPATYLKEVLTEVAHLNKRGPYNAHYSIKPEFKSQEDVRMVEDEVGGREIDVDKELEELGSDSD